MSETGEFDGQKEIYPVKLYLFEGGRLPERMSERAIGYDVFARAIVSPFESDTDNPLLRKTIFDFYNLPSDATSQHHVEAVIDPDNPSSPMWAWRLDPGKRALVGIGFATCLPDIEESQDSYCSLQPRSGLASRYGIQLGNSPGTIDADYRGEAGALLINMGDQPFYITHGARIAQMIFSTAYNPKFEQVDSHLDLSRSVRDINGFGSTGGYYVEEPIAKNLSN